MTFDLDAPDSATSLLSSADDGWDMPPRRRGQVMSDLPKAFEPAEPDRPLPASRGVLTPAEIEALLRPDLSDMPPEPEPAASPVPRSISDFAAPQPAQTSQDHDTARRLAARLSLALRDSCGLPVAAMVSGTSRAPFDQSVSQSPATGPAFACFTARSGDVGAVLVLPAGFNQLLIETACGAQGRPGAPQPLSPIDLALLDALLRPLAAAIAPDLTFSSLETEAVFAASIAPPGGALVADLSLRVQTHTFGAQLILASAPAGIELSEAVPARKPPAAPIHAALSTVLTARVASLAVPLSRLSGLKPGATLLLGIPADQPVELVSGGEGGLLAAEAEIGRRGNRVALRITRRGPALGGLTRPASS
jgi:flagellar motor switch protein FliM